MTIESKPIYRFNAINPYQNTHDIFHKARTNNSKIYLELQKIQSCQRKRVAWEKGKNLEVQLFQTSEYTTKLQ